MMQGVLFLAGKQLISIQFQINSELSDLLKPEALKSNSHGYIRGKSILLISSTPIFVPYGCILIKEIFISIRECVVKRGRSPTGTTHSPGPQVS